MPGVRDDYFYTLQEICVLLNLLPNTFRQIAREYGDLVVVREQVRKGRTVLGLPRADYEAFRTIVDMRSRGFSDAEIRAAVARLGNLQPGGARAPDRAAKSGGPAAVDEGANTEGQPFEPEGDDAGELPGVGAGEGGLADSGGEREVTAAAGAEALEAFLADQAPVGAGAEEALLAEIAELKEELRKMDERRRDERDKILTALIRTQHELQSLRYEVGVSLSRRDRKKKRGFWAWLFDL